MQVISLVCCVVFAAAVRPADRTSGLSQAQEETTTRAPAPKEKYAQEQQTKLDELNEKWTQIDWERKQLNVDESYKDGLLHDAKLSADKEEAFEEGKDKTLSKKAASRANIDYLASSDLYIHAAQEADRAATNFETASRMAMEEIKLAEKEAEDARNEAVILIEEEEQAKKGQNFVVEDEKYVLKTVEQKFNAAVNEALMYVKMENYLKDAYERQKERGNKVELPKALKRWTVAREESNDKEAQLAALKNLAEKEKTVLAEEENRLKEIQESEDQDKAYQEKMKAAEEKLTELEYSSVASLKFAQKPWAAKPSPSLLELSAQVLKQFFDRAKM